MFEGDKKKTRRGERRKKNMLGFGVKLSWFKSTINLVMSISSVNSLQPGSSHMINGDNNST